MSAGLAGWLAERRPSRVLLIAGLLPLGFFGILSAAIVVMTSALKGWRDALQDCAMALAILLVLFALTSQPVAPVVVNAAVTWTVAGALGAITGAYGSLSFALQLLVISVLILQGAFSLWVPDSTAFWSDALTSFATQLEELGVVGLESARLTELAPMMLGLIGASLLLTSVLALVLGLSLASRAGGRPLRPMFTRIRLGYVLGIVAAVAGLLAPFVPGALIGAVVMTTGVAFAVQGLAVVHWHIARLRLPWPALIPIYGPLFLGNVLAIVTLLLLAAIGFVDNWFNLRSGNDEPTSA